MGIFTAKLLTRNGTASEWTTANPTLEEGEMGIETDTGLQKVGDGTTAWATLPYFNPINNRIKITTTGFIVKKAGNVLDPPQTGDYELKLIGDVWTWITH